MSDQNGNSRDLFTDTHWPTVHAAGQEGVRAEFAREEICLHYRLPLYLYIRKRSASREDAEDLLQEFLVKFIFGTDFGSLGKENGKFRAYVVTCLNHFLSNNRRSERAQKRGGGAIVFSLDTEDAEVQFLAEASHHETPEVLFDRKWAETVLNRAWAAMKADFEREGKTGEPQKTALFEELKRVVEGEQGSEELGEIAERLRMTSAAFRQSLKRFRDRYHAEVRATVAGEEALGQETIFIRNALKL